MTVPVIPDPHWGLSHCHSRWPPVISDDPYLLLFLAAEPQFGRGEQTIGNQDIPVDAIIDELGFTVLTDDEQRRHFALGDPGRELDIDFAAVVIRIDRTPGRIIALNHVAVAALTHLGDERCERQSLGASISVFGVEPGDRWHIELFTGAKF